MAATKSQLRDRVLRRLQVLAAEEAASAEDATIVEKALENLHSRLLGLSIIPGRLDAFTIDTVPDQLSQAYVEIVAKDISSDFGQLPRAYQASAEDAMKELRRQCYKQHDLETNDGHVSGRFF